MCASFCGCRLMRAGGLETAKAREGCSLLIMLSSLAKRTLPFITVHCIGNVCVNRELCPKY